MRSTDPAFETKAADVIGLYLNPPQHAAVFCLDEKTAIQAQDRLDPVLPLSPGRAERHGFEYQRHGTVSLYAALNTRTGEVIGETAARHTSDDFLAFLGELVETQPGGREVHIILDNLATHKNAEGPHVPGRQSPRVVALHPHVLILVESSRTLVCQDRPGHPGPRYLHLRGRPAPKDPAVHSTL